MSPSQEAILREVQLIMKELFQMDQSRIVPTARLVEDLDLDSLDALDLAVKVEDLTGDQLDEQTLRSLKTIEHVVVAVDEMLGAEGLAKLQAARG
ncbi:MAG: acyl carrier protein [Deltaproteobacteria bacterium]